MSTSRVLLLLVLALLALVSTTATATQQLPEVDTTGLMEVESETEAESAAAHAASQEMVSSLKLLLEQRRAADQAARAKLEAAAERTLAVEHALAEKSAQLKAHNKMMSRLEACLADGPAHQQYAKLIQQMKEKETILVEQKSQLETQVDSLKEQEDALTAAKAKSKELEAELAEKNSQLQSKQAELDAQHSLLATREQALATREATLLKQLQDAAHVRATQDAEIERRVSEKVAEMKLSFIAEKEKAVNAVRAELQGEMHALLEKQSHVTENDKLALKIAAKHEMKRLTSADAELTDVTPEPLDMMMIESKSTARNESSRDADFADRCTQYSDCSSCGADGGCAWCSSTRTCLRLDVNANFRKSAAADGLTSGQCPADSWNTAVSSRLTLLSLNVFASDHANSTKRFAATVQLFKKTGADVIALQEVEKWFVHALQAHSWVKANYHFSDFGPGQAPGGLYILSRYPISSLSYYEEIQPGQVSVTERGRVLVATLGVRQHAVTVATTNLDWRAAETRAKNLDYVFHILKQYPHVFLLGDFNFDDGSKPESEHIPKNYLDVWSTLQSENPGFTWDPRHNWYAAASDPHSRSSRIDRILVKSNQWMPRSIHLVGCSVGDPLCAARNLRKGNAVSIVSTTSELANPSVLIGQKKEENRPEPGSPKKVTHRPTATFLETGVDVTADDMDTSMVEAQAQATNNFHADFVASNHYGLLVQATHFHPKC